MRIPGCRVRVEIGALGSGEYDKTQEVLQDQLQHSNTYMCHPALGVRALALPFYRLGNCGSTLSDLLCMEQKAG
jgi:hypothetical protein